MLGEDRLKKAVERGKYGLLYRCLLARAGRQWRVSFVDIEAVLGFELPESARMHRPWWSNQGTRRGYGHALAWQLAGWKTIAVDLAAEWLVFERTGSHSELLLDDEVAAGAHGGEIDLDKAFPPYNPGPWPVGLSSRREDLYDDRGRWALDVHWCQLLVWGRLAVAFGHSLPRAWLRGLLAGAEPLRISRQILREYLAVVTRPQNWSQPLAMPGALHDVSSSAAKFDVLEDGPDVTRELTTLCHDVPIGGRQIHDANIVATMVAHGEDRLVTFDQDDFRRCGDRIVLVDIVGDV